MKLFQTSSARTQKKCKKLPTKAKRLLTWKTFHGKLQVLTCPCRSKPGSGSRMLHCTTRFAINHLFFAFCTRFGDKNALGPSWAYCLKIQFALQRQKVSLYGHSSCFSSFLVPNHSQLLSFYSSWAGVTMNNVEMDRSASHFNFTAIQIFAFKRNFPFVVSHHSLRKAFQEREREVKQSVRGWTN